VLRGEVPESRIDDAVRRMLYQMFLHGLFDEPPVIAPLPEAEHGAVARQIGEQAIVLLKNDGAALPLAGGLRSIAVIGSDADTIVNGGGSARVKPTYSVSPLDAIRARAGSDVRVDYLPGSDPVTSAAMVPGPDPVPSDFLTPPDGTGHGLRAEYFLNMDFSGAPGVDRIDPYAGLVGGFMWYEGFSANSPHFPAPPQAFTGPSSYRWTGRLAAPVTGDYELALTSNSTGRLYVDGKLVLSTEPVSPPATRTVPMHLEAGAAHDVRIEVVNDAPAERAEEGMQFQFGWIPPAGVVAPQAQAAAKLAHDADVAIVFVRDYSSEGQDHSLVLPNGQAEVIRQVAAANPHTIVVLTTAGATQTADWDGAAPALLQAFYDGQEQGNAIASVLFGAVNPSGRLPITMPVDAAHTPVSNPDQYPGTADGSLFSEGIFVGYRGYEEFGIAPRFPFGFGLSYTTFAYSDLQVGPGPHVTVTVANTGKVAGTETVQVYAGRLPAPVPTAPKALAG
jgi:beta-glucosidase